ncbi:MAG: PH domain-containing protein [Candidatus Aenigmatarchaeota archaeon]
MPEETAKGEEAGKEERVLMELKPARRRFFKEYIVAIICTALGLFIYYFPVELPFEDLLEYPQLLVSAFFFSAAFLFFAYAEARRYAENYRITESAVYEEIGIFSDRSTDLPFMKLERCGVHRTFQEKIVGIGDVRVDAGKDYFLIKGVAHPNEVEDLIESRMREVMRGGNTAAVHD